MKKIAIYLATALFAISAMADLILWKVEIIGGSSSDDSTGYTGWVNNKDMSFIDFFENHTISSKAAIDGVNVIAISSSGTVLPWFVNMAPPEDDFEDFYGITLQKNAPDGHDYCFIGSNPQLVLNDLMEGESVRFLAGYFDWDNIDWDLDIDMDKFTTFATADVAYADIYKPGDIGPPMIGHVFSWNAVPEPSTVILALLGTCLLLKRRKN